MSQPLPRKTSCARSASGPDPLPHGREQSHLFHRCRLNKMSLATTSQEDMMHNLEGVEPETFECRGRQRLVPSSDPSVLCDSCSKRLISASFSFDILIDTPLTPTVEAFCRALT